MHQTQHWDCVEEGEKGSLTIFVSDCRWGRALNLDFKRSKALSSHAQNGSDCTYSFLVLKSSPYQQHIHNGFKNVFEKSPPVLF